jgi:hypothetical protein
MSYIYSIVRAVCLLLIAVLTIQHFYMTATDNIVYVSVLHN